VNSSVSVATISDVQITTPRNLDLLVYNGSTKWLNLSSTTVYKKFIVPILGFTNNSNGAIQNFMVYNAPVGSIGYAVPSDSNQYNGYANYSMPYDWLQGSPITFQLRCSVSATTNNSIAIEFVNSFMNGGNSNTNASSAVSFNNGYYAKCDCQITCVNATCDSIGTVQFFRYTPTSTTTQTIWIHDLEIVYQACCYGSSAVGIQL
jgi:hypothetical protein